MSSLFLLPELPELTASGRRIDRLRNSPHLWLQLLSALLVAGLLSQPTVLVPRKVQRVAFVLDSSLSLTPFAGRARASVEETAQSLSKLAERTEWALYSSDPRRYLLGTASNVSALRSLVTSWRPESGDHDPRPTLSRVRDQIGADGILFFVTDRDFTGFEGVHLLAVGTPLENWGLSGLSTRTTRGKEEFEAIVRNYSTQESSRTWWLEVDGQSTEKRSITLPASGLATLRGTIPSGERFVLRIEADDFVLDDIVPFVRPKRKELRAFVNRESPFLPFWRRILKAVPPSTVVPVPEEANVLFLTAQESAAAPTVPRLLFPLLPTGANRERAQISKDPVIAEAHPLTEGLSWTGFLVNSAPSTVDNSPGGQTVVWQGSRQLISLTDDGTPALQLHFDLRYSNAERQPSFVLLVARFLEMVRAQTPGTESANLKFGARIPISTKATQMQPAEVTLESPTADQTRHAEWRPPFPLFAPAEPSFVTVKAGSETLFTGGVVFSDPRESDFRHCLSRSDAEAVRSSAVLHLERRALCPPALILLAVAAALMSWFLPEGGFARPHSLQKVQPQRSASDSPLGT